MKNKKELNQIDNERIKGIDNKKDPHKSPLDFFIGSLTSFILFTVFYLISKNIAIYFSAHRPLNDSEIVQSISTSLNTLIVGLSFLATFSFAFIGIGLFIVFIRSFFLKIK
tara:strand:+ start:111 stop:443 length:333 start_codon:yes stop_codon:yes gene_type:complete